MMAGGNSSSSVAVFIDTSLDTRLAIVVSPSDTVADLKANLRNQHALCFPDMGDLTVLSVKARRRGSFYHLCDSMLVRSAFNGIKGSWLLHMDVVSTCHQAETTRFNMTYPLLDKPNASCPSKDASTMPGTSHVVSQDGKDVGVKDYSNVDKANDDIVSTKKKKSRKRISGASNDQLLDKDSVLAEKEKHQGNDEPLKEPSTDYVPIFGSCINNKEIFTSENACSENIQAFHGDPSQKSCNMDEKKKRRKKELTPNHQNDVHSDVPELGNDDPLKDPSTDPLSKSGSCIHNKEVFVSENVRPESITLLHDDPSQKDCTMDEKKKKKRRKKESSINHQDAIHSDVQKSGNDNFSKEPSSDPVAKSGSCIHTKEVFISENVRSESITSLHDDPSQKDCTINEKKKKKKKRRKKESSINHQNEIHFDVPESGPIDTNAVLSIENQDGKKKPQEASMKDHDNLGEEGDAPLISGKDTRNAIGRDFLESDLEDPLSLNHKGSNFDGTISKVGLSMHEMGSEYTKHTDADLQGILVDKNAYPRNADVVVTTLQEAALDEIVPTKKKKTRKRSNAASNDQLVDKSNSLSEKAKYNACDDLSEQPGAGLVIQSGSSIQKIEVIVSEALPESITPLHNDPSPKECTMHEKKKKRKRRMLKEASTNHQNDIHSITDSRPIDSHVLSIENHEAMENLQGASMKDHKDSAEERDALLLSDKDARNVTSTGNLEFVTLDPLSLKHEGLNCNGTSKVLLSVHESSSGDTKQGHLTDADPKVTLVDDNADLRNSNDALTTLQEAALEAHPEEGTRALENSYRRKKKNTSGSSINKHDSFHSFGENVNEDNLEASGNNYEDPMKESDVMNTSAEVGDLIYHTEGNLEVPSFSDAKGLQCRSRKRSHNIELFNPQPPTTYEAVLSSGHPVTEDSLKEATTDHFNDQHERSKDSIVGEATLLGIQAVGDSRVLLNPTDKTSQHKIKNKPQDDDPSKLDLVNPLVPLLDKESKTKRGCNKKAVGRASDSGAVHEFLDIKVDQKPQISSSDTHHEAPLSKDDKKKSLKDKTSSVSKRKPLFDGAASESSENKFEICYRKSTSKSVSGNSSASEDSNVGLEETQVGTCLKAYAFMNSSGARSAAYGENNEAAEANILTVEKVLPRLFHLCPNAEVATKVPNKEIEEVIKSCGLYQKRADDIKKLSAEYLNSNWTHVTELHNVGKYAADAYAIFCVGKPEAVVPDDHKLVDYWRFVLEKKQAEELDQKRKQRKRVEF